MVAGDRRDPKIRDEACLTVTVWSPDLSGSLPVMVWIPGGAFLNGAGQLQLYDGSRLAANGDVVVVNVTYRVGVFGGFELGDLGDGFDDNLCLRDQIAALAWVRDNIAAFGGDANRVTVFGESAGATSVLALLASPAAEGLFAQAIAQSPALTLIADRETRAEQAQRFLSRLGVTARELKKLPQRELRRAAGELQLASVATTPTLAHGLTYGVELLPLHPIEAARTGATVGVPLVIGSNRREASLFARDKTPMLPTTRSNVDRYFAELAPGVRARVLAAYPATRAVARWRRSVPTRCSSPRHGRSPMPTVRTRPPMPTASITRRRRCGRWAWAPSMAARSCTSCTATARIWADDCTRWADG